MSTNEVQTIVKFLLIFHLSVFVYCVKTNSNAKKIDFREYLKKKFGLEITSNTKISYRTKGEFKKWLSKQFDDSVKVENKINSLWSSSLPMFIDSVYEISKIDSNIKNGIYIYFFGDTTYYRQKYYSNGKKDSVWLKKTSNGIEIESYRKSKVHGEQKSYTPEGFLFFRQKFNNGIPIDTMYNWYNENQLCEIEIYGENGKVIYHKCYSREGIEEECEGDYEYEEGVGELED